MEVMEMAVRPAGGGTAGQRWAGAAPTDAAAGQRDIRHRFGERLRQLRQQHAMTQMEVAEHFGIDRAFLSDVERGRKAIGLALLEVIALGFKVSLSELMRDL